MRTASARPSPTCWRRKAPRSSSPTTTKGASRRSRAWHGTVAADLATAPGIDHAVAFTLKTFGQAPDILINNLGVGNSTPFEDVSDERWAKSFQVNLMGTVRTCRALVPKMAARGSGSVVNTGSDLAKQPEPRIHRLRHVQGGLLYLTKALAKQYAPTVRVNTVLPGPDLVADVDEARRDRRSARGALRPRTATPRSKKFLEDRQMPMGIGNPEDVAHAVVFLASPLAKFITGAGLDIGGTIRGLVDGRRIIPVSGCRTRLRS